MPRFPVPGGRDRGRPGSSRRSRPACTSRYPDGIPDEVRSAGRVRDRASSSQMGFPGYFLVVADFINWAKDNGIRVGPGRGSGAGSMAAYAMGITDLDPLQHGLIFERFLNPERVSMPDFDVDFDERRRGEVIRYVTEKYGDERVAQIVTYGTIKAKQALKDAARVLGYPVRDGREAHQGDAARRSWARTSRSAGIFDTAHPRYNEAGEFRAAASRRIPRRKTVVDTALGPREPQAPVGRARGRRDHVERAADRHHPDHEARAGRRRSSRSSTTRRCEALGLIKMDFLGLRNLTIIDDALDNIETQPRHRRSSSKTSSSTTDGRPTSCSPAATPSACSSSTAAPMRVAAAPDEARQLRGHLGRRRAVPPGPDGRELAHQLRAAQERPAGDHADPPRARRAARRRSSAPPTA